MELTTTFLLAIAHCETRGEIDPDHSIGSDCKSVGRYQITQPYLDDANVLAGTQYTILEMCDSMAAEQVVRTYLEHYVPIAEKKAGRKLEDWEVALIHHGGPRGYLKGKDDHYAQTFIEFMAKREAGK